MRISDWSSDVCSSDLYPWGRSFLNRLGGRGGDAFGEARQYPVLRRFPIVDSRMRSEEHTSELQSLMRISYAVFCLKKQKNHSPTSTQLPSNYSPCCSYVKRSDKSRLTNNTDQINTQRAISEQQYT